MTNHVRAVCTLCGFTLLFLGAAYFAYHANMPQAFTGMITGAFGNFSGALLLALKTDSDKPNGNGSSSNPAQPAPQEKPNA